MSKSGRRSFLKVMGSGTLAATLPMSIILTKKLNIHLCLIPCIIVGAQFIAPAREAIPVRERYHSDEQNNLNTRRGRFIALLVDSSTLMRIKKTCAQDALP